MPTRRKRHGVYGMTEITEETFCHDFDEIMDRVITGREWFVITTTGEGNRLLLAPVDPEMGLPFGEVEGN
jgi:hypothetical protein